MGIRFLSDDARAHRRARPRRRRHPAGVRRHRRDAAAARSPRLHARRHDLRLGAERLEERAALRRGRLHVDHPRQGLARGNAGHRVAGGRSTAAATWSCSIAPKPTSSATTSARGGDRDAFLARFGSAVSPGFDPDRDLQRIGLANQTTMLMSESLEIGEMLRAAMLDRYGDADARRALSGVRHDLQRHPGSPGRRRRAAARQAGRPDDRDRRLQQQQHLQPGADLRRVAADLPHRRPRLPGLGRTRSAIGRSASKTEVDDRRLAAGRRAGRRSA